MYHIIDQHVQGLQYQHANDFDKHIGFLARSLPTHTICRVALLSHSYSSCDTLSPMHFQPVLPEAKSLLLHVAGHAQQG